MSYQRELDRLSVSRVGEKENAVCFWLENLKGRENLEDLFVNAQIILNCVL